MVHKRKIVAYIATSANGFIARSDGSVDWLDRARPKGNYGMSAFYKSIDTILWGRKTYDMARDFQEKGVAGSGFDTRVKNYVFTQSVPAIGSAVGRGVRERTNQSVCNASRGGKGGKDICMMGGAGIIASFLDEGEIDEFMIHIVPEFICAGIPLIAAVAPCH
jgi:dihydrofolate reductase